MGNLPVTLLFANGHGLSIGLGQKEVSGRLNYVVRQLLDDGAIEFTVPEKPRSRLQKYQLTEKGEDLLERR